MGVKDFYHRVVGRKKEEEKKEPTDYQLRRKAVRRAHADYYRKPTRNWVDNMGFGLGNITNEVKLNEALVRSSLKRNRTHPGAFLPYEARYDLDSALHYVEKEFTGEKKAKYEAAILKRAERVYADLIEYAKSTGPSDPFLLKIRLKEAEKFKSGVIDRIKHKKGGLENATSVPIIIIGIVIGLFFLSSNITGNTIGNLNTSVSNVFGAILLIFGLVGAFFYFKSQKKI